MLTAYSRRWDSVPNCFLFSCNRGGLWEAAEVHCSRDAAQQSCACHLAAEGFGNWQCAQVPLSFGES